MQWSYHCVQWQIDLVGVFVWAPAPFFVWVLLCFLLLLRCFRWRNASLARGFVGRRLCFGVVFGVVAAIDLPTSRTFCPCTMKFQLTLM